MSMLRSSFHILLVISVIKAAPSNSYPNSKPALGEWIHPLNSKNELVQVETRDLPNEDPRKAIDTSHSNKDVKGEVNHDEPTIPVDDLLDQLNDEVKMSDDQHKSETIGISQQLGKALYDNSIGKVLVKGIWHAVDLGLAGSSQRRRSGKKADGMVEAFLKGFGEVGKWFCGLFVSNEPKHPHSCEKNSRTENERESRALINQEKYPRTKTKNWNQEPIFKEQNQKIETKNEFLENGIEELKPRTNFPRMEWENRNQQPIFQEWNRRTETNNQLFKNRIEGLKPRTHFLRMEPNDQNQEPIFQNLNQRAGARNYFFKNGIEEVKPRTYFPRMDESKNRHLESISQKLYRRPENQHRIEGFDLREARPTCKDVISSIRSQGGIGSCWAVAVASVLSDAFCIASNGKHQLPLSSEDLMRCCKTCVRLDDGGAERANIDETLDFVKTRGVVTGGEYDSRQGCIPYSFLPPTHRLFPLFERKLGKCDRKCTNEYKTPYEKDKHYITGYTRHELPRDATKIKEYLKTRGSCIAKMLVYKDFYTSYKQGIYAQKNSEFLDNHYLRLIGWGEEDGIEYWLVANSWGEEWGEKGLFRINMNNNGCDFGKPIWCVEPKLV